MKVKDIGGNWKYMGVSLWEIFFKVILFLCLHKGAGGIMFSGCPSVHPSVWESRYRDIWRTPWWIFIIHGTGVPHDE